MEKYTQQQIAEALKLIESFIASCEKVQPKLKEGTASLTISKNRIAVLKLSKSLLLNEKINFCPEKLAKAVTEITSIKNKSTTGLYNAKVGSSTHTRFFKIIIAMNITLEYLQQAKNSK